MIADKIKTLRESRSMTQADLARMINVSRSSINAWEIGISTPSTKHLAELADIFKVFATMSSDEFKKGQKISPLH